jgi:hypothetical protein
MKMAALAKLKFVVATQKRNLDPVQHRRQKLASKLSEQIEMAQAQKDGRSYMPTRIKTYIDEATGQRTSTEVTKRVKAWYWTDNGKINLSVRYGAKTLELVKGKNAIEVATGEELLATLELLKSATLAGELDGAIGAASGQLRAGFGR